MDLSKQYIVQCITTAANSLRLSSEKIEVVALLREKFVNTENLAEEIKNFKKITELSKLGIKLNEIFNFIEGGKIDFVKISDKFKEHSYSLVKDLNYLLDVVTPQQLRMIFSKQVEDSINVDLTRKASLSPEISEPVFGNGSDKNENILMPKRSRTEELKEEIIFEELNKELGFSFENYEETVLRPVKTLDAFLNRVSKYDFTESEISGNIKTMYANAELSQKIGFEILSNMHNIFARGLDFINKKKISPSPNVIEALRACLIVIVAVVRGKEVDITNYLNKAESFGRSISSVKKEM